VPVHDELRDGIHHGGDGVSRECGEVSEKRLKAVCREADRRCCEEPGDNQDGRGSQLSTAKPTDGYFARTGQ
jgi:hypothetical protein